MRRWSAILVTCSACAAALASDVNSPVCSDPQEPCAGFRDHDLSFILPADGKARAEARSAPFFAVMLKTTAPCAKVEAERREIQSLFPRHKVFASRFECDGDVENNVRYTNTDPGRGFIAVYGGMTRADAEALLEKAHSMKRFAGANVRRMQVVRVSP
jgi:hypothetical protein